MCATYLLLHFTSDSLYNLSDLTVQLQILALWLLLLLLRYSCYKTDLRTCACRRERAEGGGGWSPFIGRCLTNEQRQPVRLAMLEINIFIHIYKLFLQPLDNIFIKNMTFVSVVLFMWMPFYTFVTINLHLQLRNTGVLIIVCVCKSKDSAFRIRTLRVNFHLQIQIWMLQVLEFCYWSTFIDNHQYMHACCLRFIWFTHFADISKYLNIWI